MAISGGFAVPHRRDPMKSFLIAATIALVGSSVIADTASARSRRSAPNMAGLAAMAPVALAAGTALIGSGGFVGGPVVTPYLGGPIINTYDPVITTPNVYVPSIAPVGLPGGFSLPGGSSTQDVGN
jgi:hypothetical protein